MSEVNFKTFGESGIPKHLSERPFNVQLINIKQEITEDDDEIVIMTLWDGSREIGILINPRNIVSVVPVCCLAYGCVKPMALPVGPMVTAHIKWRITYCSTST